MEEKNRQTLDKAIAKLKVHTPPSNVWENIRSEMDQYEKEATLRDAVNQLPNYKAPASNWQAIEEKLQQAETKPLKISWYRYAAAASVAILLAGGWYIWQQKDAPEQIAFQYSEEVMNENLYQEDWEKDQEDMEMVFAMFEKSPQAKQDKQYEVLLVEYAELNDAKAEIESIMDTYKNDANLIRQMSKIEMERSRIIKQMVSLI